MYVNKSSATQSLTVDLWVFFAHLFKRLRHAPIYEPLAVLISVSKTWQRGRCWIHIFIPRPSMEEKKLAVTTDIQIEPCNISVQNNNM